MSLTKDLFTEINSVRENPNGYAEKILKYIPYFEGKGLKLPGAEAIIQTKEGAEAYEEAANFLKSKSGVEPFIPSKGLFKIKMNIRIK